MLVLGICAPLGTLSSLFIYLFIFKQNVKYELLLLFKATYGVIFP